VVISPVRDEAQYLETTIQSVIQQTVRPAQWILVDDGSTDATAEIISRYAKLHSWITPVHRPNRDEERRIRNRGTRARQAKEIEAFYGGYRQLTATDWEYLAKIDGDVGFEPNYFERCFAEFGTNPKLGIGGGVICNFVDGRMQPESTPRFHVRGATKIYRRGCWDAIGGVIQGAGWDTLDEVKANMLGWQTRTFPDLKVAHYRFTGTANGAWNNAVKNGLWSYIAGYHPLFMLGRCTKRVFQRPYLVGAIGLLWGFLVGYLQGIPQTEDKALIHYLRRQQLNRTLLRNTIWK
jgi:glycosyltransferase involved in cell wall biosynthesis